MVPTRWSLVHEPLAPYPFYKLGWGARANAMLQAAAAAVARGEAVQLSAHLCGWEDREQPHCFFAPFSGCGGPPVSRCTDGGSDERTSSRLGNCAAKAGRLAGHWASPTQEVASSACRLLTGATLGGRHGGRACSDVLGAWRRIARALLRVQPEVQARVEEQLAQTFGVSSTSRWWADGGCFGALHIRRRDKVAMHWWGAEAQAKPVCSYADALAELAARGGGASQPCADVFVATDDSMAAAPGPKAPPRQPGLPWAAPD